MIDISEVNEGDRVRLSRTNGDETTFEVSTVLSGVLTGKTNAYPVANWDSLEIVERAIKPVPGLYTNRNSRDRYVLTAAGEGYYTSSAGGWIYDPPGEWPEVFQQRDGWKRDIAF